MFWNFILATYIFFVIGAFSGFMKMYFYSKRYAKEQLSNGKKWTKRAERIKNNFSACMGVAFISLFPIVNVLYFFVSSFGGDALLEALEQRMDGYLEDS